MNWGKFLELLEDRVTHRLVSVCALHSLSWDSRTISGQEVRSWCSRKVTGLPTKSANVTDKLKIGEDVTSANGY